jgi:hypothetical protein
MADEKLFTKEQLAVLRAEWASIERVLPESQRMAEINKMLEGMSEAMLRQILGADIKWLSRLAATHISERGHGSREAK